MHGTLSSAPAAEHVFGSEGSASHGTNYSRLDHFHSPPPFNLQCNAPAQEDIKRVLHKKWQVHLSTGKAANLRMHKMFPDSDPDNLIFCFFTLIPVALRTGCGIVEHIDFHQRIVLYRINQPTKSIYLLFMSMGYFSSEIMILVEIKLNTIKPSGDGGRTAGSYLRTHGTTISQTKRC